MSGICEGRVVIITGAGRGIGRAHALEFARQGAKVVVNDLGATADGQGSSTGPAGEVVDEIRAMGGEAVADGADVADWAQAEAMIRTAVDTFGRLDVLVNAAGILRSEHTHKTTLDFWNRMLAINLTGTFLVTRECLPALLRSGRGVVVNFSSTSASFAHPYMAAYAASKGGVVSMILPAARELGPLGIRVVGIAPGLFGTQTLFDLEKDLDSRLAGHIPFPHRFGDPAEFAMLVIHVMKNVMINGSVLRLDGGYHR